METMRTETVVGLSDVWFDAAKSCGLAHDKYNFTASNWEGTAAQVLALAALIEAAPKSASRTVALRKIARVTKSDLFGT